MHRRSRSVASVLIGLLCIIPSTVFAQRERSADEAFMDRSPRVGEPIPDVAGYDESGQPFPLRERLRGSYTVLVFGCLT